MLKQLILSIFITFLLVGCGGGSPTTVAPPAQSVAPPNTVSTVTTGVITGFGSVFVNGVEYETDSTEVTTDDDAGASESDLQVGMIVMLSGEVNEGGHSGTAVSIHYDEQLKGPLHSIDLAANTLTVLGQTVMFDESTSLDGVVLSELIPGDMLEISGFFNAEGILFATRIEKESDISMLKVQGFVSSLNSDDKTFQLNDLIIDYSNAEFSHFTEADLVDGLEVRVKGPASGLTDNTFIVTNIKLKDREHEEHNNGDDYHVEGFITAFDSASSFMIGDIHVITDSDTEFEQGTANELALNVQVKVKGEFNATGDLVAGEIHIQHESYMSMEGTVQAIDLTLGTVTVMDVVFYVNDQTKMEDDSEYGERYFDITDLNVGDYIEIKGYVDAEGANIATKMERNNGHEDEHHDIKGPVSNIVDFRFDVVGITVTTNADTVFYSLYGQQQTQAEFFELLQPDMMVEVEGQEVEGVFIATRVEMDEMMDEMMGDHHSDGGFHSTEFRGTVEAITDTSLVVSDHVVLFYQDTDFEYNDEDITAEVFMQTIVVGDQVMVKGYKDSQGVITAKSIDIE